MIAAKQLAEALPDNTARLVTFAEGCRYGRFGKDKAYELIAEGKITAYKDGRLTFLDLNSIDAYHKTLPRAVVINPRIARRRRQKRKT